MRQSLETSEVSYGMDCMLFTAELRSSGDWELRIDFAFSNGFLELNLLCIIINHFRVGPGLAMLLDPSKA